MNALLKEKEKAKAREKTKTGLIPRKLSSKKVSDFQKVILDFYNANENTKRHSLPWRKKSRTPYQVLVSEIMLQQTQVDRVVPFFKKWMKAFPNFKKLADAKTHDVLSHWKGLGYNSRALRLQKLAQIITEEYKSRLPKTYEELLALPGIGPYTAAAVLAFAYDTPKEMIETNIRRVYIHHFYKNDEIDISDDQILHLVNQTLPDSILPSVWFWALMDYGSTLPKIIKKNPNTRSKSYAKQAAFKGSDRQVRGAILEVLLRDEYKKKGVEEKVFFKEVKKLVGYKLEELRFDSILGRVEREGSVVLKNDKKNKNKRGGGERVRVWMIT